VGGKGLNTKTPYNFAATEGTLKGAGYEVYEAEFLLVNGKTDSFGA
jgi:hypothetical protein